METKKIKKLTLSSMLLGINILFVTTNLFLPISIIILIAIPFSTTITKIKCGNKYTLLTIISAIIISSLIDFQTTIFYLLPSLITGLLFGIFIDLKLHSFYNIIFTSLIGIIIQAISFLIIQALYQIDIVNLLTKLLNIDTFHFKNITITLLFLISFIQTLFSYIIIENDAEKFKISINKKDNIFYPLTIQTILLSSIGWTLSNSQPNFAHLITSLSIISSIYLIYYIIKYQKKITNITLIITLVITYFICLINSSYFKTNGYHLIFNIFSLTTFINGVILIIYVKLIKKEKINDLTFNKTKTND